MNEFLPTVEAADPELVRSIENWKADWKKLRERMLSKSKSRHNGEGMSKNRSEREEQRQEEKENAEGYERHEENPTNGKERNHEHEHGHEHSKKKEEAHHDLSAVMEVTEESIKNGQQERQQQQHHQSHQQGLPGHHHHHYQHHNQQFRNGNDNGVDGLDENENREGFMTGGNVVDPSTSSAPAHAAVRVSRTGA